MNSGFKYGKKTTTEISNIPTGGLEVGDNVYNTSINKEEVWTGNVWLSPDCVEVYNNSGVTLTEGYVVGASISVGADKRVTRCYDTIEDRMLGVVFRGGANNTWIAVAQCGVYNVRIGQATAVTRGHLAVIDTSVYQGGVNTTGAKTGGSGIVGVFASTGTGLTQGSLVPIFVQCGDVF